MALALLFGTAAPAGAQVVINEVDSQNGVDETLDFVELYNPGPGAADISGYIIQDSTSGDDEFTVPPGTTMPSGTFFTAYVNAPGPDDFGLGSEDAARLLESDGVTVVDEFAWTEHAAATYGLCPDGVGDLVWNEIATPNGVNDCPEPAFEWPGAATVAFADGADVFGENLSGLTYQPSGTAAKGVLWATRNGPPPPDGGPKLYRLVHNGTTWVPDTANGWSNGKSLLFENGSGVPDAEGVTLAAGDATGIYVSIERDDTQGGVDDISRPAVLRFDVTTAASTLSATEEWDITDLPGLDSNAGLEAVTWIPDDVLVAKGFENLAGDPYDPAAYPDHGAGLFFVGVEQGGSIIAYALNQTNGTFTRVALIASGFPAVMGLEFEPETGLLWAMCDNGCDGRHATLDVAGDGTFQVKETFDRPAGMANLNNEGFAIAPRAECVSSRKPVFWADDSNTAGHALRSGTVRCTDPEVVTPIDEEDKTPIKIDTPAGSTTAPPVTAPLSQQILPRPVSDLVKPRVSSVRATRSSVRFRLSEAARVTITIEKRSGRRFRRLKRFAVASRAGTRTVSFRRRVAASKLRRGRLRITLVATDAAGNRSAPQRRLVGR